MRALAIQQQVKVLALVMICSVLSACHDDDHAYFQFEGARKGKENKGIIRIQFDRDASSDYSDNADDVYLRYVTESGTAESGVDFFPTTGTLIWDDFDYKARNFEVILIDDTEVEGTEQFFVRFTYSSLRLNFSNPISIKIEDDDGVPPAQTSTTLTYVLEIGETDGVKEIRLQSRPLEKEKRPD